MSVRRDLVTALCATLAAGLLAAPAFAAKPLNWNETFKNADGKVLNFRVSSLTVTPTGWTARVSFTNLSKQTVHVGNEFAIAFFVDAKTTNPVHASALLQATAFSPKRPTRVEARSDLEPGRSAAPASSRRRRRAVTPGSSSARSPVCPGRRARPTGSPDHQTLVPALAPSRAHRSLN